MSNAFEPLRFLAERATSQSTGCLLVNSSKARWRIFFHQGELLYADNSVRSLAHLQYFLLKNGWNEAFYVLKLMPRLQEAQSASKIGDFERGISWLWERDSLPASHIQQLIEDITQDALETFLWLTQGIPQWMDGVSPPEWIPSELRNVYTLDLEDIVRYLQRRLKSWQSCTNFLCSPHHRPYVLDIRDINRPVTNGTLSADALEKLSGLMRKGLSLRQLSLYIKQDELHVGQLLTPYIDDKIIHLRNPIPPFDLLPDILRGVPSSIPQRASAAQKNKKIICIDDSPTVLSEMKRFLGDAFQVLTINDPVQAAASIFQFKPDLILMDITMPRINGYRLCSLLRSSEVFDEIPIIMVSSNTGLIDKARAKISGATDYLTKPFDKDSLMTVIDKHLIPQ